MAPHPRRKCSEVVFAGGGDQGADDVWRVGRRGWQLGRQQSGWGLILPPHQFSRQVMNLWVPQFPPDCTPPPHRALEKTTRKVLRTGSGITQTTCSIRVSTMIIIINYYYCFYDLPRLRPPCLLWTSPYGKRSQQVGRSWTISACQRET